MRKEMVAAYLKYFSWTYWKYQRK